MEKCDPLRTAASIGTVIFPFLGELTNSMRASECPAAGRVWVGLPAWEVIGGSRGFAGSLTGLPCVCDVLSGLETEVH